MLNLILSTLKINFLIEDVSTCIKSSFAVKLATQLQSKGIKRPYLAILVLNAFIDHEGDRSVGAGKYFYMF